MDSLIPSLVLHYCPPCSALLVSLLWTWLLLLSTLVAGAAVFAAALSSPSCLLRRTGEADLAAAFVAEEGMGTYGMPGIFIAGILSAALR